MGTEWRFLPLGELCSRVTCGFTNPMPTVDGGEGPFLVTAKDIKNGKINYTTTRKTTWDAFHERLTDRSRPNKGDVLLTKDGSIGRLAICDRNDVCIASSVALIQGNGKVTNEYIKYVLESPEYQRKIEGDSNGTTIKHIYITRVDKMVIPFPPPSEQKAIAHILGTLDDKIELNRKTNKILEDIAKALFKSWFVDFDPVRAKAEGRPTGLPDEISELFPDSFEESELGEIPIGWELCSVGDLLDLERGSVNPADTPDELFDYYSIPAFDEGMASSVKKGGTIKSNKYLLKDDTFLISKLNPKFSRVWIPSNKTLRRRICSTEFLVCCPKAVVGIPFAYCLSKSVLLVQQMSDLASGTSNSHQRVRPADLMSIRTIKPSDPLLRVFARQVELPLQKLLLIRKENQSLAKCRNALLPRLISGELRVPDAEKMLEEVGV